ncbi:MAG: DUF1326 domain-containing protein [Acidobacteria bacterium]|nr:DUF1326 domain-containing protein [Acidobacteriota bacterium]
MSYLHLRPWIGLQTVVVAFALAIMAGGQTSEPSWYLKAHIDEACSCPLFCPCYFNTKPANDYCNFNNVFSVQQGHYGNVKLDGMHVWLSGNLGGDFSQGKTEAVVAAFEPSATQEQVDAFMKVATKIYPVTWQKISTTDRTAMTITHSPERHTASRADGKGAVELVAASGSANDGKSAPRIENLRYFGAGKNAGFNLYYGTHRYNGHGYNYSYTKHNGFTIDIEAGSPTK